MVSYVVLMVIILGFPLVLILIVVDDGLVLTVMKGTKNTVEVLILIVVDDGLVQVYGSSC